MYHFTEQVDLKFFEINFGLKKYKGRCCGRCMLTMCLKEVLAQATNRFGSTVKS